ncbi:hypothetical protein PIB30_062126 [Stylosanthes scabra]|uniref:Aminotransferase-like plant mobile domain-containing protein n=1 Tax=Stylosanthes scabra TaxID=79078 RepID=A0ABU6XKW0_9FABA|nr:hypothetical protein [Stylosanthes scabra]
MPDGTERPWWDWFEDMFGQLPNLEHRDASALFGDKTAARVHLMWLPFIDPINDLGGYSWGIYAEHLVGRCFRWRAHCSSCRAGYFGVFPRLGCTNLTILSFRWNLVPAHFRREGAAGVEYRRQLDRMTLREFVWMSYRLDTLEDMVHPSICYLGPMGFDSATHLLLIHRVAPGGSGDLTVRGRTEHSPSST